MFHDVPEAPVRKMAHVHDHVQALHLGQKGKARLGQAALGLSRQRPQAISRQLDGTGEPPVPRKEEETDYLLLIILVCCFIIVPTLLWFSVRQRKRCPQCHKHTLRQLSIRTISRMNGIRTEEIVLHCTNCGHIVRRQRQVRDEDDFHHRGGNGGPFLGGPFFGGGFGGSGGGGFSGGSFGGGSFGGGGAGSKF